MCLNLNRNGVPNSRPRRLRLFLICSSVQRTGRGREAALYKGTTCSLDSLAVKQGTAIHNRTTALSSKPCQFSFLHLLNRHSALGGHQDTQGQRHQHLEKVSH